MALVYNGTSVEVVEDLLPNGYVKPVVVKFTDLEYDEMIVLEIDKATVDNATQTTTMDNIIADAAIGVDKQMNDILVNDFHTAGVTVTAYAEILKIDTNMNKKGVLYTDGAPAYKITVKYYVKTS